MLFCSWNHTTFLFTFDVIHLYERPLLNLSQNASLPLPHWSPRFWVCVSTCHATCYNFITCVLYVVKQFVTLRNLAIKNKAEETFNESTVSQNSIPNKKEIRNQGYNYQDITKFGGLGKLKKKSLLRACSAQIQTRNSRKIVKKKVVNIVNNNIALPQIINSVASSPEMITLIFPQYWNGAFQKNNKGKCLSCKWAEARKEV